MYSSGTAYELSQQFDSVAERNCCFCNLTVLGKSELGNNKKDLMHEE